MSDLVRELAELSGGVTYAQPNAGQPVSQSTEVRFGYTDDALIIGVIAFDNEPDRIIATDSRRDSSLDDTDSQMVTVTIDGEGFLTIDDGSVIDLGAAKARNVNSEPLPLAGKLKDLRLYWGVRAARDLYDAETARRWARERPSFGFTPVLSSPAPDDGPEWRTGLVHEAVLADCPDMERAAPADPNMVQVHDPAGGFTVEAHAMWSCVDCHSYVEELPHAEDVADQEVNCLDCHEEVPQN